MRDASSFTMLSARIGKPSLSTKSISAGSVARLLLHGLRALRSRSLLTQERAAADISPVAPARARIALESLKRHRSGRYPHDRAILAVSHHAPHDIETGASRRSGLCSEVVAFFGTVLPAPNTMATRVKGGESDSSVSSMTTTLRTHHIGVEVQVFA